MWVLSGDVVCFSTKLIHLCLNNILTDNPYGATWGNMTWMHATSKNLVHWKHVAPEPSLVPSLPHDQAGIFSGAMLLQGPKGEAGMLTAIYTAVNRWCSPHISLICSLRLVFTHRSLNYPFTLQNHIIGALKSLPWLYQAMVVRLGTEIALL